MLKIKNNFWFTLVELLTVVTIMAILWTISFIYFTSYVSWSRDSKRIVDIKSVSTALEVYYKKNNGIYPKPSSFIITSYTWTIWTQSPYSYLWYIKDDVGLSFNKVPNDPTTGDNYIYATTVDWKYYELACTLEQYPDKQISYKKNIFPETFATDVWTTGDFTYIEWNYKKDINNWRYTDHIVFMTQSGSKFSFPKSDLNIWTFSWTDFIIGSWIVILEQLWTVTPYPINNRGAEYINDSSSWTSDFMIETESTWITLNCPNCE
jgi:type II secretory pathway pseudopilin PulG